MEPTKIQWTLGITKNLGNFESMRIDCQVTDYKHEDESASEASTRIYKFVENQLNEKIVQAMEESHG